jgi:hypothetical protein
MARITKFGMKYPRSGCMSWAFTTWNLDESPATMLSKGFALETPAFDGRLPGEPVRDLASSSSPSTKTTAATDACSVLQVAHLVWQNVVVPHSRWFRDRDMIALASAMFPLEALVAKRLGGCEWQVPDDDRWRDIDVAWTIGKHGRITLLKTLLKIRRLIFKWTCDDERSPHTDHASKVNLLGTMRTAAAGAASANRVDVMEWLLERMIIGVPEECVRGGLRWCHEAALRLIFIRQTFVDARTAMDT